MAETRVPQGIYKALRSLIMVIIGFLIAGVIIQIEGYSAIQTYSALISGSITSFFSFSTTLYLSTPVIMAGLGALIAFRAGLFNIGVEGQLYIGGFFGFLTGYYLSLPTPIELLLVLISGALGGAIWVLIPALLKAYRQVNEFVTTVMLNYVASYLVSFLTSVYKSPSANSVVTAQVNPNAQFPQLTPQTPLDVSFILALFFVFLTVILINRTRFGYELKVLGSNPYAAEYARINVKERIVITMLISGSLAGIGGAFLVNGAALGHFDPTGVQNQGINGITAALIGQLDPIGTFLSSILIGMLNAGVPSMEIATGIPPQFLFLIISIIMIVAAIPSAFSLGVKAIKKAKGDEG